MSDCKHGNFQVMAEINRLIKGDGDDTVLSFVGKFKVHCADCKKAFELDSLRDASRSIDREELRVVIKPATGQPTGLRTRVHIADMPDNGKQKCFRCDTVLARSGGQWVSTAGQDVPLSPFWKVGAYVGITERTDGDPLNPIASYLMDHDATRTG